MTPGELRAGANALKTVADQHTVFGRPVSSFVDQSTIDAAAAACINAYIQQHAINVAHAMTMVPAPSPVDHGQRS